MSVKVLVRAIGVGVLAGGVIMCWKAYQHSQSWVGKLSETFGGSPPRTFYELLIPGIILVAAGLGLIFMPVKK